MRAPQLSSDRLILKPLTRNHCTEQYVKWLNDPEVIRFLETGGDYTFEKLDSFLGEVEKKDIYFWAIHLKSNNLHIGNIKIDPISSKHRVGEYGILLGERSSRGFGYAEEASILAIKFCFSELNLRKITLGVVVANFPAVKLYEKLSFKIEGILKDQGIYGGKIYDSYRMALFNPIVNE